MKILFRADSSSKIGLGHIMRDLVLAEQFKDDEIIFACQDLYGNIMDKIPYTVEILKSSKLSELIDFIKKNDIDMLVIDHYDILYEDEKEIKEKTGVKILSFDDTYERHYCDVLLNHNIGAKINKYRGLVSKTCEIKCGSKYTLIRSEYKKEEKKYSKLKKSRVQTIFLAIGGSDHSGIIVEILKVLKLYKNIEVNLVITSSNIKLKQIKKFTYLNKWIILHIDSQKLSKLMKESDYAIISPSVISYELLYLGLPFFTIMTGNDQIYIHKYFTQKRLITMQKFKRKKFFENIKIFSKNINMFKNKISIMRNR